MTMTKQRMFDMAWTGLKAQGFEKSYENGHCLYRGPHGLKCAIGHCIADEDYGQNWESFPASVVVEAMGWDGLHSFANDLQSAHDGARNEEDMEADLRNFAITHNLTIPGDPA